MTLRSEGPVTTINGLHDLLAAEFSGDQAQSHVAEIGRHYRSPGSAGYHAAIDYIAETLRAAGVDFHLREFPLDGSTKIGGETVPLAWEPHSGVLTLIEPEHDVLVRWADCPSCLPWWCPPTPAGGAELQLVDVGTGTSDADYQGKSAAGRAVLVHDAKENSAWRDITERASRHGAAAIITNYLLYQYPPWRTRMSLPEAVQQLRLAPRAENPWAFTVPQPVFERLQAAMGDEAALVVVRLEVSARTFAGSSRSVLATIPAADPSAESFVFISHVSAATMPGANCASGVALLLELARAISHGVASGAVPALRRNIHFLFANEGYGSQELAEGEPALINGAVAAVAVCSVGHDQGQTKSSLVIGRSPDALPTFLNDLVESLAIPARDELPWAYRPGAGDIPYVRWKVLPYTPWSDNTTWSALGIPALLAMSLPDRYFHTQLLTAGKTDPVVFKRVAAVLGAAALVTACAGTANVATVMRRVAAVSQQRMIALAADASDRADDEPSLRRAADALSYLTERDCACLRSALRLVPDPDGAAARSLADQLERRMRETAATWSAEIAGQLTEVPGQAVAWPTAARRACSARPHGIPGFSSYAQMAELAAQMSADDPDIVVESLHLFADGIWYHLAAPMDIGTLARALSHEFGMAITPRNVLRLVAGMEQAGLVTLSESPPAADTH